MFPQKTICVVFFCNNNFIFPQIHNLFCISCPYHGSYFSHWRLKFQLSFKSWNRNHAKWYTPDLVCDDGFNSLDAASACFTLGFNNGGFFETIDMSGKWSQTEIPILLDEVSCPSNSTNFLSCQNNGFGIHDCGHSENVLLTCIESGKNQPNKLQKMSWAIQYVQAATWTHPFSLQVSRIVSIAEYSLHPKLWVKILDYALFKRIIKKFVQNFELSFMIFDILVWYIDGSKQ